MIFGFSKLNNIKKAAKIVSDILLKLKDLSQPNMELSYLEKMVENLIIKNGAKSYNKGYFPKWAPNPYPSILCASINEEAVHCPPKNKVLREGDIVKYDIGIRYKDRCGDAALTIGIGNISKEKKDLIYHTRKVLEEATKLVKADLPIMILTRFMENYMAQYGYKAIKGYSGHGIGKEMHEKPIISNSCDGKDYGILKENQVICIEPIFTTGNGKVRKKKDGWSVETKDGKPVAQFESMVLVKKNGYEILTYHL